MSKQKSVQIGNTMQVYIYESGNDNWMQQHLKKDVEHALNQGKTVIDGKVTRFRQWVPSVDSTKSASEQFEWDKTGEKIRCRHEETIIVEGDDMEPDVTLVKYGWRSFHSVFN